MHNDVSSLIPIYCFIFCKNSLFAVDTQCTRVRFIHCSGVLQSGDRTGRLHQLMTGPACKINSLH